MHLSTSILGKNIVARLMERQSSAVLIIGSDHFTRPQLAKIGCFNFHAAARLSQLITTELKVKNTRELFFNVAPGHLALPGLGAISLATLGAAFEAKGIGTLDDYIARHTEKGMTVVTFNTMKHNALDAKAAKAEKKATKDRKARRGRTAHEHRVRRHIERSTPAVEQQASA